jgi:hypothetical protein
MTPEKEAQVCEVVRKLVARSEEAAQNDLPAIADLAGARAALAKLRFPPGELTLQFLALVCVDQIDDIDCVRLLRDVANDEALAVPLVSADERIDRVTFLTLIFENVCRRLSAGAWRELGDRSADGRVREAHVACEIVAAAFALRLLQCERIDSLQHLQELSVAARNLLESEANVYPAGPFPLPDGMRWVRHGGEAAQLMRSPQGRLFFDYENMLGSYHTCYTDRSHFLGVNSDGVPFSFTWYQYPGEPLQRSSQSPAA